MTDDQKNEYIEADAAPTVVADDDASSVDAEQEESDATPVQYGVGPFSIREVALGGVWLVAFVVSFFPIYGQIGSGVTVWGSGIDWILTVGAPTIAVFLLALRRLSPQGIRRVGSLGVDQFASVAFTVSTIIWLALIWNSFIALAGNRFFFATWVVWVEVILMFAGVVLTVFAPLLPVLGEDFRHRREVPAHRVASPARAVTVRPRAERPAKEARPAPEVVEYPYGENPDIERSSAEPAVAPVAAQASASGDHVDAGRDDTASFAGVSESHDAAETTAVPTVSEPFWALAPVPREVVDADGVALFEIGPDAWALVVEDRGDSFVVRHEDGRIGELHDVTGITRG